MHPPMFSPEQRLSDWPDCRITMACPRCGKSTVCPVSMMIADCGDVSFRQLVPRLICVDCKVRAAPVYLCAGHHRKYCGGPTPDWAVELVPEPREPL